MLVKYASGTPLPFPWQMYALRHLGGIPALGTFYFLNIHIEFYVKSAFKVHIALP